MITMASFRACTMAPFYFKSTLDEVLESAVVEEKNCPIEVQPFRWGHVWRTELHQHNFYVRNFPSLAAYICTVHEGLWIYTHFRPFHYTF
jgi:hypothetical protein